MRSWIKSRPEYRYINSFLGLKCAVDLLTWNVFPDAKEITETYSAWHAVFNKLKLDPKDTSYKLIAVGDGHTPRTAAFFAVRSKWNCISVDPALKPALIPSWHAKIQRLECLPNRIQDIKIKCDKAVIVAVHAHVKIKDMLSAISANSITLIAMPCCVKQTHESNPDFEYEDESVWSGKRIVKIWKNIH